MNVQELLQLADFLSTHQAITQGNLKQELEAIKSAQAELNAQYDLVNLKKSLAEQQATFKQQQQEANASLKKQTEELRANQKLMADERNALDAATELLNQGQSALARDQRALADTATSNRQQLDSDQHALQGALAQLASDQAALKVAQDSVAAREAEVARKLEVLKGLA